MLLSAVSYMSTIEQILKFVEEGYAALGTFMKTIIQIKNEEREIINDAVKSAEDKKITTLKSKIKSL